jgi:hypothetical protein
MPKIPMDYSKTIIYKIVCNDLSIKECYVGHTINMTKRKCCHKSTCNNEKDKAHNLKIYQIIRENGGWDNWSMLLVEKFPCKDKYEACKREREVYEELEAKMNTFRPYRTQEELKEERKEYREEHKEYHKQYREEHKEEHKEYHKQYREEHKAEKKQYRKQYYQEHKEETKQYQEKHKAKINEKVECKYCSKLLLKRNMTCHHKTCKSKSINEGNYLPSSDSSIESGEIELKNRIDNI